MAVGLMFAGAASSTALDGTADAHGLAMAQAALEAQQAATAAMVVAVSAAVTT